MTLRWPHQLRGCSASSRPAETLPLSPLRVAAVYRRCAPTHPLQDGNQTGHHLPQDPPHRLFLRLLGRHTTLSKIKIINHRCCYYYFRIRSPSIIRRRVRAYVYVCVRACFSAMKGWTVPASSTQIDAVVRVYSRRNAGRM